MALGTSSLYRNLSRLELAIAIVLIAVLVALFMRRMATVELAAEQTRVAAQVYDMQARLMTLRTRRLTSGEAGTSLTLDDLVPLMGDGAITIAGQERGFAWAELEPGSWVYFRDSRRMAYRTITGSAVEGATGDPPRVSFRLEPVYHGGRGGTVLNGARLLPLQAE